MVVITEVASTPPRDGNSQQDGSGKSSANSKLENVLKKLHPGKSSRENSPEPGGSKGNSSRSGGSSRRKPTKTIKVVSTEEEEDVMDIDDKTDDDVPINIDEHGNRVLEDGTMVVEPEPVEDKAPKTKKQKAAVHNSFVGELDNIFCTACYKQMNPNVSGAVKKHPVLKVLICKKCYQWYASDEIEQDSDGMDEQCRWCGEGGNLLCCDFCHNAFCKGCIKRNLGRAALMEIQDADEDAKWHCYVCNQKPLAKLMKDADSVLEKIANARQNKHKEKEIESEQREKAKREKEREKRRQEKDRAKRRDQKSSNSAADRDVRESKVKAELAALGVKIPNNRPLSSSTPARNMQSDGELRIPADLAYDALGKVLKQAETSFVSMSTMKSDLRKAMKSNNSGLLIKTQEDVCHQLEKIIKDYRRTFSDVEHLVNTHHVSNSDLEAPANLYASPIKSETPVEKPSRTSANGPKAKAAKKPELKAVKSSESVIELISGSDEEKPKPAKTSNHSGKVKSESTKASSAAVKEKLKDKSDSVILLDESIDDEGEMESEDSSKESKVQRKKEKKSCDTVNGENVESKEDVKPEVTDDDCKGNKSQKQKGTIKDKQGSEDSDDQVIGESNDCDDAKQDKLSLKKNGKSVKDDGKNAEAKKRKASSSGTEDEADKKPKKRTKDADENDVDAEVEMGDDVIGSEDVPADEHPVVGRRSPVVATISDDEVIQMDMSEEKMDASDQEDDVKDGKTKTEEEDEEENDEKPLSRRSSRGRAAKSQDTNSDGKKSKYDEGGQSAEDETEDEKPAKRRAASSNRAKSDKSPKQTKDQDSEPEEKSGRATRAKKGGDDDTAGGSVKRSRTDIESQRQLHLELLEDSSDEDEDAGGDDDDTEDDVLETTSSDEDDPSEKSSGDEYRPDGEEKRQSRKDKKDEKRLRIEARREARENKRKNAKDGVISDDEEDEEDPKLRKKSQSYRNRNRKVSGKGKKKSAKKEKTKKKKKKSKDEDDDGDDIDAEIDKLGEMPKDRRKSAKKGKACEEGDEEEEEKEVKSAKKEKKKGKKVDADDSDEEASKTKKSSKKKSTKDDEDLDETEEDEKSSKTKGKSKKKAKDDSDDDDDDSGEKSAKKGKKSEKDREKKSDKQKKKVSKKKEKADSDDEDTDLDAEIDKLAEMPKAGGKGGKKKSAPDDDAEDSATENEEEEDTKSSKKKGKESKGDEEEEDGKSKGKKGKDVKGKKVAGGSATSKRAKDGARRKLLDELGSGSSSGEEEMDEEKEDTDKEQEMDVDTKKGAKFDSSADEKRKALLDDNTDSEDDDEDMSDFESSKKGRKKGGGRKKKGSDEEDDIMALSSDDSLMSPAARKALKKNRLLREKLSGNSTEEDSDSDIEGSKKKKKKKRKAAKKDESSTDSDSDVGKKKKGKKGKGRKKKFSSSDFETDSEAEEKKKQKAEEKEQKKKRKRVKQLTDSSCEEGAKAKSKAKAKGSDAESNDDSDDEHEKTPGGRKKIRKILKEKKFSEQTKSAVQEEEERRKRIVDNQKRYNQVDVENEEAGVKCPITTKLVLEVDSDDEPVIQVDERIIRKLKPHQVEAIKFLWGCIVEDLKHLRDTPGTGCILAHCMGLGKTLSIISFVHTLLMNEEKTNVKRILVVCPLNTVLNWQVEFQKWVDDDDGIDVYEMASVKNNWARADTLSSWKDGGGVLILSYEMFRNLTQHRFTKNKKQKAIFTETLVDPGADVVVCDEGHVLKNDSSALSKSMNLVKTRRRIVLTGTPLQNNLIEYHCMISFVKPSLLGTRKEFSNAFVNPINNGQHADSTSHDVRVMKRRAHILHEKLDGCVQRRDYSALMKFLPPKHEYVVSVKLSSVQIALYRRYLEMGGSIQGGGSRLFSDYQQLMRIWTHPWVMKLEEIRQENKRTFDDDSEEDSFIDESSGMDSFIDDSTSNSDSETSKKGKKGKKNKETDKEEESKAAPKHGRRTRATANGNDGNDSDVEIINEWKTRRHDGEEPENRQNNEEDNQVTKDWWAEFVKEEDKYKIELSGKLVLLAEILKMSEAIGDKVLVFSQSLLSLDLIEDFLDHWDQSIKDPEKNPLNESDDVNKTAPEVPIAGHQGWTHGSDYFRMDGSTASHIRQRWVEIFNEPDNIQSRLFLISTKAGGLGINMVAANRVIIFDASWNPSHDIQSIFRVFRFGQTKPVYIYRFLAQGTMEEKIYGRQVNKQSLSQRVIDEHQIERHFNHNDLNELYNFQPDEREAEDRPKPALPKDLLLAELLTNQKEWIIGYHEHDSLLENKIEQELSEEERKAAWEEYEQEKKGIRTAVQGPGISPYLQQSYNYQANLGASQQAQAAYMAQHLPGGPAYLDLARAIYQANPTLSVTEVYQRVHQYIQLQMANRQQQQLYLQQQLQRARQMQTEEAAKLQAIQADKQRAALQYSQVSAQMGGARPTSQPIPNTAKGISLPNLQSQLAGKKK